MKKIIYILVFLFSLTPVFSQNKLINAKYFLQQEEFGKAKELIDAAVIDSMFNELPVTWYIKGHIYKGLYNENESEDLHSPYRVTAINDFKKCIDLEPEGQYAESAKKGLRFLATRIYNQAAGLFNEKTYTTALAAYEYHKEVMRYAYPETDFLDKDIMFKLRLASIYNLLAGQDTLNTLVHIQAAEDIYKEVLSLDSNNISANYNLGIIYYNQGVEIVNNMDYSLDLMELTLIQDEIITLFRKSLPYMKKAYDLNPTRKETLIGLQGIYFSLNDMPKSELFKKELEKLEGSGKPTQVEEIDEEIQD